VRFVQYDGSTSLPFKSQRRYHLGGDVVICPSNIFKKIILSVFKHHSHLCCETPPPPAQVQFCWMLL
jgi:hypothetical protein